MYADIVIINGKCMTMKNKKTLDWIAIKNDKIIDLGQGENYLSLIGDSSIILNANHGTVLPGFIDSHFHVVQTAMNADNVQLNDVHNFEEIGKKIREMEEEKPGEPIIGVRLEKEKLQENAFPNRMILDQFSGNVPVWINCLDYQVSMLNTYGLLYYKVPFRMEGVEMDNNGVATGIFRGNANATLRSNVLDNYPNQKRKENISDLMPKLLSNGITTVNAMEGGYMYSDRDADFIFEHGREFPVDMALFYQSMDYDKINNMKLDRIGGCLYVDGTMGERTAALTFEYADSPGEMGSLKFSQDELNEFVVECYKRHLQISLYTIGGRAIEVALNAHEFALYKTGIKGLRHRLEHVELANPEQIIRAQRLGIIFSMNPTYESYWGGSGGMYSKRLGANYGETNKFREIIDSGIVICAGSDSDVCDYDPLIGIHAAVNHPVYRHRVTVYEALEMYTVNGAYSIFEEDNKGTLEVGKQADVIILDSDIETIPAESIDKINVMCTVKSGEIMYSELK